MHTQVLSMRTPVKTSKEKGRPLCNSDQTMPFPVGNAFLYISVHVSLIKCKQSNISVNMKDQGEIEIFAMHDANLSISDL